MLRLFLKIALSYVLVIGLLLACNPAPERGVSSLLHDVESYINERPDSALAVLEGLDSTVLTTRALRARYSLLHVMALDKCYKDITASGLLDEASNWYEHHGTADEKMKSLYYQGRIAQDRKDQNSAAVYYARAEEYADKVEDQHALGLLYLTEATIYNTVHNYEKEKEYIERGLAVFQGANDQMQGMALGQLAISVCALRDWDRADSLFTKGVAASESNPYAMSVFLSNYARMKLLQPSPAPEEALNLLDMMRIEYGFPLSLQDAGAYAYALTLSGRKHEAEGILNQIKQYASPVSQEIEIWISRCAMAAGDYKQAYESLNRAHLSEESSIRDVLTDSVSDAISSYREMSARQSQMKYRIKIAVLVIILLFLCLALALAQNRRNMLEADVSRIMGVCSILEKEAEDYEAQTADLQNQLKNLRETARQERVLRFRQAGKLQSSIWRLDHHGPPWARNTPEFASIKKDLSLIYDIETSGEKLVQRLDRDLDGKIVPLVKELHLQDKSNEQLFLCCCLLDLPAEMVAARFGWTSNNVRVKKSRLKDQIAKLNNADYDALFDIRKKNIANSFDCPK